MMMLMMVGIRSSLGVDGRVVVLGQGRCDAVGKCVVEEGGLRCRNRRRRNGLHGCRWDHRVGLGMLVQEDEDDSAERDQEEYPRIKA